MKSNTKIAIRCPSSKNVLRSSCAVIPMLVVNSVSIYTCILKDADSSQERLDLSLHSPEGMFPFDYSLELF